MSVTRLSPRGIEACLCGTSTTPPEKGRSVRFIWSARVGLARRSRCFPMSRYPAVRGNCRQEAAVIDAVSSWCRARRRPPGLGGGAPEPA
jgi:hypothetical protein